MCLLYEGLGSALLQLTGTNGGFLQGYATAPGAASLPPGFSCPQPMALRDPAPAGWNAVLREQQGVDPGDPQGFEATQRIEDAGLLRDEQAGQADQFTQTGTTRARSPPSARPKHVRMDDDGQFPSAGPPQQVSGRPHLLLRSALLGSGRGAQRQPLAPARRDAPTIHSSPAHSPPLAPWTRPS